MIRSFADKNAEIIFSGRYARRLPPQIQRRVAQKLDDLHAASNLRDLGAAPGHHLEALKGDRIGQYSIRVNDQWRLCFRWHEGDVYDVEMVDYH